MGAPSVYANIPSLSIIKLFKNLSELFFSIISLLSSDESNLLFIMFLSRTNLSREPIIRARGKFLLELPNHRDACGKTDAKVRIIIFVSKGLN